MPHGDGGWCSWVQQAGHAFCLALTSEGEVLGWGRNDQGQLGLGGGLTMVSFFRDGLVDSNNGIEPSPLRGTIMNCPQKHDDCTFLQFRVP